MQAVTFTPHRVPNFVRQALKALQSDQIGARFGMVFLHDLDPTEVDNMVPGVPLKDSSQVTAYLGPSRIKRIRHEAHTGTGTDNISFPIGNRPTKERVAATLTNDPGLLFAYVQTLSPAARDIEGGSHIHKLGCQLFVTFTRNAFLLIQQSQARPGTLGPRQDVNTLLGAIKAWSVHGLRSDFYGAIFELLNVGVGADKGRKSRDFGERREIFFPNHTPEIDKNTPAHEPHYLRQYWGAVRRRDGEEAEALNKCLASLLSECHCLPSTQKKGSIWSGNMVFVVNPRHCKIEGIGPRKDLGPPLRRTRAQLSKKDGTIAIMVNDGMTLQQAKRAQFEQSRPSGKTKKSDSRSAKAKNWRKPPKKITR